MLECELESFFLTCAVFPPLRCCSNILLKVSALKIHTQTSIVLQCLEERLSLHISLSLLNTKLLALYLIIFAGQVWSFSFFSVSVASTSLSVSCPCRPSDLFPFLCYTFLQRFFSLQIVSVSGHAASLINCFSMWRIQVLTQQGELFRDVKHGPKLPRPMTTSFSTST